MDWDRVIDEQEAEAGLVEWMREKAATAGWQLQRDRRTICDADGAIVTCERQEDAVYILRAASRALPATPAGEPSPPIWCRDALADGTESQRLLRDGLNRPIITLHVMHPRSGYNEDFILASRNAA